WEGGGAVADDRIGIIAGRVSDTAKPAAAGSDLRLQHGGYPNARGEGGVTDNPGTDFGFGVAAGVAHGGDTGDEFGLTDGFHVLGAMLAIHRVALQENA